MAKRRLHTPVIGEHVPLRSAADDETEAVLLRRIEAARAEGDPAAAEAAVLDFAVFCSRTGRQRRAVPELERLAQASGDPTVAARSLLSLGQVLEQARDYEAAREAYARGIGVDAPEARTRYFLRNNLAFCLLKLDRPADAEPLCREAIAIDPLRHNAHKNLGLSLAAQGRPTEAAAAYLAAAELAPGDTRALMHLRDVMQESPHALDGHPELRRRLDRALALMREAARRLQ